MNSLDIIILAIIGLVAFRGYQRGLIREAVSLCSVFVALFVAAHLHTVLVPHLKAYFSNPSGVVALSYLIAFVGTLLALWFLVRFLQGVLKVTMLTLVDKITGAAFGGLEGLLLCLVVVLFLKAVLPGTELVRQSSFAKKTEPALAFLADITPAPVLAKLHKSGFNVPRPASPAPPHDAPAAMHKAADRGRAVKAEKPARRHKTAKTKKAARRTAAGEITQ